MTNLDGANDSATQQKDVKSMTFEAALRELELIVRRIDSGSETLDMAVASFERGVALQKHCEQQLQDAKLKIEKVIKNSKDHIEHEEITSLAGDKISES